MKLKWIPTNLRGAVAPGSTANVGGQISSVFMYADIDTYNTLGYSLEQVAALDSNRIYDPTRTFKRYFGCKTISA